MIQKEAWYREAEDTEQVLVSLWSDFQTRDPKPGLQGFEDGSILVELTGFTLRLRPLMENSFEVLDTGGKFALHPSLREDYGFFPGEVVGKEDLFRFVLDFTEPATWQDQVASDKHLLKDKRSRSQPNKSKLKVKSFMPHFGIGPTYYGIIDESCGSWLKDHEYKTEAEAKKALAKCKSGKAPLEFRGF